ERRPATVAVARVDVGAAIEEDRHGGERVVACGPHQRRDAGLVGLVGEVAPGEQAADGSGGVRDGGRGDGTRGCRAACGRGEERGAHSDEQHEAVHELLQSWGGSYTENFAM